MSWLHYVNNAISLLTEIRDLLNDIKTELQSIRRRMDQP